MKYLFLLFFGLLTASLPAQTITWPTVQPVFLAKCASCHRPGDAAPFSLVTYEDIAKRLSFIKTVIQNNYMPPWRADVHYSDFANNRSLTPKEKELILKWIVAKAPKGEATTTGKEKTGLLEQTAYGRKPDLTLQIDSPILIKGDNTERFITFKIPFNLEEAANIEAIEFYTNNKKIIHHVNYGIYQVADTAMDIKGGYAYVNATDDDRAKEDVYKPLMKHLVYYTGWIPGASVESYPKGLGWSLPKRGVVLVTAHYSPLAVAERSEIGVNLFFRKDSIRRQIKVISLGSGGIGEQNITPPLLIMPNRVSAFHLAVTTVEDQSVLYVWPHMHLIGKAFVAYAVTPADDTIRLVHIPDWDFRWQELYRFKKPVKIPKGSVVHIDGVYDNTAANPFNPNNPPKAVYSFGDMLSTNEMMTLLMIYLPYEKGDEQIDLRELPAAANSSTPKKK
jgi:hypothetical protein